MPMHYASYSVYLNEPNKLSHFYHEKKKEINKGNQQHYSILFSFWARKWDRIG